MAVDLTELDRRRSPGARGSSFALRSLRCSGQDLRLANLRTLVRPRDRGQWPVELGHYHLSEAVVPIAKAAGSWAGVLRLCRVERSAWLAHAAISAPGGSAALYVGYSPKSTYDAATRWVEVCGRDSCCQPPPAQIRTCGFPAYGSYLE
jgi:hypothetical protein